MKILPDINKTIFLVISKVSDTVKSDVMLSELYLLLPNLT